MRKVICFVLLIVLFGFFVVGQSEEGGGVAGNSGKFNGTPADLKNALSEVNGSLDASGFRSKTNEVLAKEIQVPENWKIPARIVFGLKADDPVDLQTFIVLVAIWFSCLIFMKYVVELMPIIGEGSGLRQWFSAIVVTLLIAVSGGLLLAADFFADLGRLFGIIREWGILTTVLAVIIAFFIVYIFSLITAWLKSKAGEAVAFRMGEILKRLFMTAKISQEPN